jgi:hypothetical protein
MISVWLSTLVQKIYKSAAMPVAGMQEPRISSGSRFQLYFKQANILHNEYDSDVDLFIR